MRIQPSGHSLGATIEDIDLARQLSDVDFARLLLALG